MSAAETIAREMGSARRSGDGWLCRCPCVGHGQGNGDRNPSLLVKDGDRAVLVKCFAECDSGDIIDELRRRGLLGGHGPRPRREYRKPELQPIEIEPDPKALAIWRNSVPIEGTLAARYVADHRGIPGPHPPSLRFAPSLRYPPTGLHLPAMVAAIQAPDRKVVAVQSLFLRASDGRKAPVSTPRINTGALGTGTIRLGAVDDVLGLAEGTESGLSAQFLTGIPTWSCLGAARMHRVAVRPSVRELHLLADDDESGRKAAERTADLHRHLKIEIRYPPPDFGDWNEVGMERLMA